ncbi:MAG: ferredoxin [Desulfobacteraceae bacterium]|nr:MAG: ferredoxin [Desulfobacteraceae bacterium]
MKQPIVDMESCILCDICTELAPDVFVHNDLGFIEVVDGADYSTEMVKEAIKNCPSDCISYE